VDQVSAQTVDSVRFELRVLSGIVPKTSMIGPSCAGMSFERQYVGRLSSEMSQDSL